jgi:hypothetical protein
MHHHLTREFGCHTDCIYQEKVPNGIDLTVKLEHSSVLFAEAKKVSQSFITIVQDVLYYNRDEINLFHVIGGLLRQYFHHRFIALSRLSRAEVTRVKQ